MVDTSNNFCDNYHFPKYRQESRGRLILVLAVISIFMIIEVVAGLYTHSLALLADAGHMLADMASLMLATATLGLVVNVFSMWLLHKNSHESLNVKAVYLELLGDLLDAFR